MSYVYKRGTPVPKSDSLVITLKPGQLYRKGRSYGIDGIRYEIVRIEEVSFQNGVTINAKVRKVGE